MSNPLDLAPSDITLIKFIYTISHLFDEVAEERNLSDEEIVNTFMFTGTNLFYRLIVGAERLELDNNKYSILASAIFKLKEVDFLNDMVACSFLDIMKIEDNEENVEVIKGAIDSFENIPNRKELEFACILYMYRMLRAFEHDERWAQGKPERLRKYEEEVKSHTC